MAADHTIGIATVRQQQPNGIEMMLSHGVLQRCVSAPINLVNTRPVTNQQLSQGGAPLPAAATSGTESSVPFADAPAAMSAVRTGSCL